MKRYIFLVILLCWHSLALATISMHIDPTTAQLGETIRLTLTNDNDLQGSPDLTPLKKDFSLVGTEHSMFYTAANGVAKSENQWVILLVPKKTGLLTIPPIKIGQQFSPTGEVNISSTQSSITDSSDEPPQHDKAVTLDTEVDQEQPFINQQIIYTVKLSTSRALADAQYQPPSVANALLIPLGDGRSYQTTMHGQEYNVDEQQYAIYPQKSGELQIFPPKLMAVVSDTIPKRISLEGKISKLMVKPIPKQNLDQQWLPAKQVTLSEQYDLSSPSMLQGSTLVRKITLQAIGLPAELLPALNFADSKQFNMYPEKPDLRNVLRQQELVGNSTIKVTYILNQPGQVTIPSIDIAWFNTQTGKQEISTLPARDINITGKIAENPAPKSSSAEPTHHTQSKSLLSTASAIERQSFPLAWWVAGAFAFVWVLTLGLWWFFRKPHAWSKHNIRLARARLRKACGINHPQQACAALLNWSRQQWPNAAIFNLNELSMLVQDIELKKQINLLSQALYAKNGMSSWQGHALWRAVDGYRPRQSTKINQRTKLPPINPDLG